MINKMDIAKDFSDRLVYRDRYQGDGKSNAIDFRNKFLNELESEKWWKDNEKFIELDFSGVKTLGPSWANEVFAYYTKNHTPKEILNKIKLVNISNVKKSIIKLEIETGYSKE